MFDKFRQLGELKKMRDQAMQLQKQLEAEQLTHEDKNVKVTITGNQKIKSLIIDGVDQERAVKVLNDAIKKSQKMAAKKLQQMGGGLTGMLKGLSG